MSKRDLIAQTLKERLKPAIPSGFNLNEICFKEQLDFINDPNPWITASCSRRAGKSTVCAVDLWKTAAENPGVVCIYITLTHSMAEKVVWQTLLDLNQKYRFNAVPNLSKLTLTLPNRSKIYVLGCANKSQVEKVLGVPFKLAYFDECQSFPSFIGELVDRVVAPALMDYAGSMKFIGTPAPVMAGYFWNILQNSDYSHHHWTYWDNPYIPKNSNMTKQELLDRELKRRGVVASHPSILREWYGKWTTDTDSLVFCYDRGKNHYEALPPIITDYVIAADIGFNDADAIAIIGWNKHIKKSYLIEEIMATKQGITPLVEQLSKLYEKYKPLKMVMDEGGLGKKIGEELRKRYSLPIYAAEKSRKQEYIALLNDSMRTGQFLAKKTSRFAQDCMIVEWDLDKCTSDKRVIKHEPHSDICDAVLYGFRESLHYLSEPRPEKPDYKNNYGQIMQKELIDRMELEQEQIRENDMMNDADTIANMDPYNSYEENAAKYYVNNRSK